MHCDCCEKEGFNGVIILRKERFTQRGKNACMSKFHHVCFFCFKRLIRNGYYIVEEEMHNVFHFLKQIGVN